MDRECKHIRVLSVCLEGASTAGEAMESPVGETRCPADHLLCSCGLSQKSCRCAHSAEDALLCMKIVFGSILTTEKV